MRKLWLAAVPLAAALIIAISSEECRKPGMQESPDFLTSWVPKQDDPEFESAVLAADAGAKTDADVLEAARLIEAALRARPGRAEALARLLPRFGNRGLAFRATLIVAKQVTTSGPVRGALLEALERGGEHGREVAAYGFYGVRGDPEAARALARTFLDETADPRARAAQGFSLAGMLPDLDAAAVAPVRAAARRLAGDRGADAALRAEAVGLLDVGGEDRDAARALLREDPDRSVALSAARVLLRSGEDERSVGAALLRFTEGEDLTSKSLRAMLRGEADVQ